jgi:acetyl esterase
VSEELEPRVQAFVEAVRAANLPPIHGGTAEEARAIVAHLRTAAPDIPVAHVEDRSAAGPDGPVPLRLYRPAPLCPALIVYLHGGGWVLGGIEPSDSFARTLAVRTGCAVLSVDYRLAPEAPYPAALDDGWAALGEAARLAQDRPLILLGDSAGATLSTVLAARARDAGGPAIAAQILAYPVTDARMETESYRLFADDLLLPAALMRWFWNQYAPAAHRSQPDLSPINARLNGLPPAFVLTASHDVLRDEGEAYAAALSHADVPVHSRRYAGQIHSFLTFLGMSEGGEAALADIAAFIDRIIAA